MPRTPWIRLIFALSAISCLPVASATAQRGPYGYGYGWGAYPYNLDSAYNTSRQIASQQHLAAQKHAFQQSARTEGSIRNTLSSEARRATQGITAQQQGAKDWWFKQEQRKLAERKQQTQQLAALRASGFVDPNAADPAAAAAPEPELAHPQSQPAQTGVTPWPNLLRDSRFEASRAKLEAVFREWKSPKHPLTPEQYRKILDGIGEMKTTLRDMAHDITAAEYLATEKYLDGLVYEARAAVQKTETPEATPATTGKSQPEK